VELVEGRVQGRWGGRMMRREGWGGDLRRGSDSMIMMFRVLEEGERIKETSIENLGDG